MSRRCRLLAVLLGICVSAAFELHAESVYEPTTGFTLDVQEDGTYGVSLLLKLTVTPPRRHG